ncbi:chaoptin, partial [Thrips palmi]|uniref:Chaoptin n=1 Tax=Thrips palmi TaxID=161013 RepID=A0A6P8Z7X8_THRPL
VLGVLVEAEYIPPGPRYRCPTASLYPCSCLAGGDQGLLVRCHNTNLATLSVGLQQVARLGLPIERLSVVGCNIGRLYGALLHPLKVRVLVIEDTPLTSIDPGTFYGVNRTLQELHVVRSKLQEFPTTALQVLGNLTLLKLDGHDIAELPSSAFADSLLPAHLSKLHVCNGHIADLPLDVFQPLRKLSLLDLHGNNITQLKKNQFKGLRDVEVLDLSHNALVKLDSSHLADLTKMASCNVSHNDIGELTRGTFARNTVLRVLNMAGNRLKRLDGNSFRGMRFIRRLFLADNQIADVGRGTFGGITRVGTIDLARNKLAKIDFQMFQQLQYCELIDVSENQVTEIAKLSFKDLYLVRINLSHNAIETIEPGAFENCANVTVLDMSHNKIGNIPRTAFDANTYATELQLSYNLLTDLAQVPLHNMTGLKVLNVSHNLIERVPRNVFPKLYELHTVDLSHNALQEIWNGVFQTLFGLRFLNLSHNAMTEVRSSTFGAVPTLLELDLSHNNLSDVGRGSLARLASLRWLTLAHNQVSRVFQLPISLSHLDLSHNAVSRLEPGTTWPSMNALLGLDLSHNGMTDEALTHGSFANLLTLQRLDLSHNALTRPPWEALGDLTSLQYLYLQHNQLTELPRGAFGRLPVVFELELSHNQIANVSARAFDGLLQLLTLNLTANSLTYLPNGALQGLVSLRTLDLSHNQLERLDNKTHGLLDDCLSLERVNLSHNKISFVTKKTFPSNPYIPYRLREVDLSHNVMPVLTHDLAVGTKKVEVLNVSHNMINEIRKGVVGNLTALRVLDLSHNELVTLSEGAAGFRPPRNLTHLYLRGNRLVDVPGDSLAALRPGLQVLDVRANEVTAFHRRFLPLLMNGTEFRYEDNPFQCSCVSRPLRHWLGVQATTLPWWGAVRCAEPQFLAGQALVDVAEDRLVCDPADPASKDPDFDISPDLKFREIKRDAKGAVAVSWYVTTNEDVADFLLVVRDTSDGAGVAAAAADKEQPATTPPDQAEDGLEVEAELAEPRDPSVVLQRVLPYTARAYSLADLPAEAARRDSLELCVLAQDSGGSVRRWRRSQCRMLPAGLAGNALTGGAVAVLGAGSTVGVALGVALLAARAA